MPKNTYSGYSTHSLFKLMKVNESYSCLPDSGSKGVYRIAFVLFVLFFLFIEFIGVTVVTKIIQISGAQLHSTSCVHFIVCSSPQVKSPSVTIYMPPPTTPSNHHTVFGVHGIFLFFYLFAIPPTPPPSPSTTPTPDRCQPAPYVCVISILLFNTFCSLDSTNI